MMSVLGDDDDGGLCVRIAINGSVGENENSPIPIETD